MSAANTAVYTEIFLRGGSFFPSGSAIANLPKAGLVTETLRAHFRVCCENIDEFLSSGLRPRPARSWIKKFPNGAGDLRNPLEFVIADPDVEELEKLFDTPDTGAGAANDDIEDQS